MSKISCRLTCKLVISTVCLLQLGLITTLATAAATDHEALGAEASNCPATSRRDQHASYQACHERRDGERCGSITSKDLVTGLDVPEVDGESIYCITRHDAVLQRTYPCCAARLQVAANGTKRYAPVDFTQFDAQFFA